MKALIIEDERLVGEELKAMLKEVAPDIQVQDILPSLKSARKWFLYNAEPDLIFMDVQLADGISFSLFDQFRLQCPVIFTTAYDEYAIRAFKVNAVDYLLKPVERGELAQAVEKCRHVVAQNQPLPVDFEALLQAYAQPESSPRYKEKFIIRTRGQWIPVNIREVACIVKDNLIYLYTFAGQKHILESESLEELESLLDPRLFFRANRQVILHIDAIKSVKPREYQKLTVYLQVPGYPETDISRERAPAFRKWFDR